MDEPFSAVDPVVRKDLQDELLRLQGEPGKTILLVTHDIDEAIRLGDKIANAIPLAYRAGLTAADMAALDSLSAKLSTANLAEMMTSVVIGKQYLDKVAHAWLANTFPRYGG